MALSTNTKTGGNVIDQTMLAVAVAPPNYHPNVTAHCEMDPGIWTRG
jgi:hypothetical protein